MEERMQGLGKEIEKAGWPDFVLLQVLLDHGVAQCVGVVLSVVRSLKPRILCSC